jgi:hypothetical protein
MSRLSRRFLAVLALCGYLGTPIAVGIVFGLGAGVIVIVIVTYA